MVCILRHFISRKGLRLLQWHHFQKLASHLTPLLSSHFVILVWIDLFHYEAIARSFIVTSFILYKVCLLIESRTLRGRLLLLLLMLLIVIVFVSFSFLSSTCLTSWSKLGRFFILAILGGLSGSWSRLVVSACLAEHIGETKLTHSITIRNLTLSTTDIWIGLKDVISIAHGATSVKEIVSHTGSHWLSLVELAQGARGKHKVALVWIVLHGTAKHHCARLQAHDILTLNETALQFEFVQQVVPQVVFG